MTQAFAYLDDIIVHAPNVELHLEYLEKVLQVHLQAGLRLQPHKTNLLRDEAVYLGHVINSDGVRPDPAKLDAVQDWPQPTNITELQSYLGLCNYYRDFIPMFALAPSLLSLSHSSKTALARAFAIVHSRSAFGSAAIRSFSLVASSCF